MAEYAISGKIICENCRNTFEQQKIIYNIVNMDSLGDIKSRFLKGSLNTIKCPICKKKFIFETELLVYSLSKKYAIMALPDYNENCCVYGKRNIYSLFKHNMNCFRLVNYQYEAIEKVSIFENNLNDIKVEKLKAQLFDKKYFENKKERLLLFKGLDNDKLVFKYIDFLGKIVEEREIPFSEYTSLSDTQYQMQTSCEKNIWHRIDTNFFKEK